MTHKWRGFRRSRRYHSNRQSCSSTRCWCAPCVPEQEDSMRSVPHGCWLQAARLSGEWKGYRLFCQLSSVLIMFKYLKVTKLQSAENGHKGLSLRLPRVAEGNQQKRIKRTEQNNHRCYDVTLLIKPVQWAYRESSISRLSADGSVFGAQRQVTVLGDTVNKDKSWKPQSTFLTLDNSLRINSIVERFIVYLALLKRAPQECGLLPVCWTQSTHFSWKPWPDLLGASVTRPCSRYGYITQAFWKNVAPNVRPDLVFLLG